MIDTLLFDFDGTLVDTAADLNHAVNIIRQRLGLAPLPLEITTPIAGNGARALLLAGNDIHDNIDSHVAALFDYYKDNLHRETKLYAGMEQVLKHIEKTGMHWGIVTNRLEYLTRPLLVKLNLQPAIVVCGDNVTHTKPHPESVIKAYTVLNKTPEQCLFIGDNIRDIKAGKAAGVKTVAALYGYIDRMDAPANWGADYQIKHPEELVDIIM